MVARIIEVVVGSLVPIEDVVRISEVMVGSIVLVEDVNTIGTEIGDSRDCNSFVKRNVM